MEHPSNSAPAGSTPISAVIRSLARLRARVRVLLVAQRVGLVLAVALGVCIAAAAADYFLRTPGWLRLLLWAGGISALGWAFGNIILPAVRFRPPLSELALRVERGPAGRKAGLDGVLTAGVELAAARERGDVSGVSASLAEPVVTEAARRYAQVRARDVLTGRQAGRSAVGLAAGVAVLALLTAVAPALVATGALRVLAPWSDAQWPKRTMVASATPQAVHPLGEALALRALVGRRGYSPQAAAGSRVWGMYRLIDADGRAGPVRSILLTSQDRVLDVPGGEGASTETSGKAGFARGMLFERLIEPASLAEKDASGRFREGVMEFWFQTDDDRTPASRLRLVEPPAVASARAEITPPAYAARLVGAQGVSGEPRTADLGAGNDERAVVPGLLTGSRIRVTLSLNKPVPAPPEGEARAAWLAAAMGEDAAALAEARDVWLNFNDQRWEMEWVLRDSVRLAVRPKDEHGLGSVEEAVFRFEALTDEPPTATVTEPDSDRTVLPSAVVDVRGEGRDDVGLAWVGLERRRATRPQESEGAPAEPTEEWTRIASTEAAAADGPANGAGGGWGRQLTASARIDLAELSMRPGDELWLSALAADAFELDGRSHEPARSATRRLLVISSEEFATQIWAELGTLRRSALRLDEEQQRLSRTIAPGAELGPDGAEQARRGQAGVTERLSREQEAVSRLRQRMQENRFQDRDLENVVQRASDLVREAGSRSVDASRAVEDVARTEESGQDATDEQRAKAAEAQGKVRDALADLADLLDEGRDTWSLRRSLERALEEQRALRDRTREASAGTAGKGVEELSAQERRSLEQIASEQAELADRTAEALQRMMERSRQMQESDPSMAKTVEQAAQRGQRDQVPQRMDEASEQIQQNQGNSALTQQDRAIQSLEQMLQDMEQGQASKDAELRRILASIIESLDELIADQRAQIEALEAARPAQAFAALPEGMIRLHQNTLRVLEEANAAPRELAGVAELIDRASDAQAEAIRALRATPVDDETAEARERTSLEHLINAREEAQRLDEEAEDRENQRRQAALKRAYREALAEQVAIAEETDPLVGVEPNRRTRAQARQLAERQRALRQALADIRAENEEISETAVFSLAHDRLDKVMDAAAATLAGGTADAGVAARQASAVRILQSLLAALDEAKKDDEFRDTPESEDDSGGGGGGSGGSQLIPDVAELRMLRALQAEAIEITRMAEAVGDEAAADDAALLQRDIADRAETLMRRLFERQEPGAGGGPGGGGGEGQ